MTTTVYWGDVTRLAQLHERAVPRLMTEARWQAFIVHRKVRRNPDVIHGVLNKMELDRGLVPAAPPEPQMPAAPVPPAPDWQGPHIGPAPEPVPIPNAPAAPPEPVPLRDEAWWREQRRTHDALLVAQSCDNRQSYGVHLITQKDPDLGVWETSLEVVRFTPVALPSGERSRWLEPVLLCPRLKRYDGPGEAREGHRQLWSVLSTALGSDAKHYGEDAKGGVEAVCSRLDTLLRVAGFHAIVHVKPGRLSPPVHRPVTILLSATPQTAPQTPAQKRSTKRAAA